LKSISELIALLIVVAIIIGATVTASLIVSGLMQKQNAVAADLVFSGGGAYLDGTTLVVKATATVVGSSRIVINSVEVYKGTTKISAGSVSAYYPPYPLAPGSSYEIIIYFYGIGGTSVAKGDRLTVVIYWTDTTTGTRSASRGTVIVG